jgi:hypothetical protein
LLTFSIPKIDTTRALSALIRLFFAGGSRIFNEFEAVAIGEDKGDERTGGEDESELLPDNEPIFSLMRRRFTL